MRSKPLVVLFSFVLLLSILAPMPGPTQAQAIEPRASKLDGALQLLQQMATKGVWWQAPEARATLSKTLDVDLNRPDPTVTVLIQVRDGWIDPLIRSGFFVQAQIGDVVTATVPIARLDELAALSDVMRVEASKIRELTLDRSIPEIRADQVRTRNPDGTFSGRTGRGVVIGIIDTGIDWKHPDFQTPQGRTRIKFLWDVFDDTFRTSEGTIGLAPPIRNMDGTPRGTVYIEAQINSALDRIAERVDGWVTDRSAVFVGLSDDRTHLVGIPGTAAEAITVGAYISKTAYVDSRGTQQNEETLRVDLSEGIGSLAFFSSPGPTRDARQKPEITAPGAFIGSTWSRDVPPDSSGMGLSDPNFILPDRMHYIDAGTSQAAPHVTGAVALMLEKNPLLDASQIKQILMTTARQDSFTNVLPQRPLRPIPDPAERMPQIFWGAGKLDVQAALNATP